MLLPCARSRQQNFHWSAGIQAQDCTRRHKPECHTFRYSHNFTYLFNLWLFLVYLTTVEVLLLTQCRTVIPKSVRKASWISTNPSVNIADLRTRSRTRDFRNINLLSYPFCTDVRLITFCKVFRDCDLELLPAAQRKEGLPDTCSTRLTLPANAKRY